MDVFKLREEVVKEYREYVSSFINILDPRVDEFVRGRLKEGELWPDPALQLNPAYQPAESLGELAAQSIIQEETASFFGHHIRLYRHQREALDAARRGDNYVVTTGTGSGKSLTYLVPIYDAIMRDNPQRSGVRAVLVYPMNALINSQEEALKRYARGFPGNQVRFAQYTGQTSSEERNRIINDPPHILLTNYVMLEYLLLRPADRSLLMTATKDLQFIVMDELHFYRGRQGADVGMLLRRLSRNASEDVSYIGTSATVASEGSREERRRAVADVAGKLFGAEVRPDNVIEETLVRITKVEAPKTRDELCAALDMDVPTTRDQLENHPLAAWMEFTFGLSEDPDGRLVRPEPQTFADAVRQLADRFNVSADAIHQKLQAILDGDTGLREDDEPDFAFRLHQFLSSGSSVYTTLEGLQKRKFRMESQYKLADDRLLVPLAFCRECGQDYYLVTRNDEGIAPRLPLGSYGNNAEDERQGYFAIDDGNLWDGDMEELPDNWMTTAKQPRFKNEFAEHRPERMNIGRDGKVNASGDGVNGWFQPMPWLICLRCRVVYDRRQSEYRKMASFGQTGRSTATTLTVNAGVSGMLTQKVTRTDAKVLSFTDNRQDASLQAGHLNDFVQTAQVRAGLVAALNERGELGFEQVGDEMLAALNLGPVDFLAHPVDSGPGWELGKRAIARALQYRALEDLSRGWRIVQPNLEQVGLLKIRYHGLTELASDDSRWVDILRMEAASPGVRERVLTVFLDHLRMQLAIETPVLSIDGIRQMRDITSGRLREPWSIEPNDQLRQQSIALLPGMRASKRERDTFSLGSRSAVTRYLRSEHTWGDGAGLDTTQGEKLVTGIVSALKGHILTTVLNQNGSERGVRIIADSIRWTKGDGTPSPPDPVRSRYLHMRRQDRKQEPNRYFSDLYENGGGKLAHMLAREHTGQVSITDRREREKQFRDGTLPLLFCSPTMELGVDISELQMVHMRNIPPTPANYAQRSGRAGRGGRAALIAVFAANGNAHDQHYFRLRNEMIAGAVVPARMDLQNKELLESHIHSLWLAETGISLGNSIKEILELEGKGEQPIKDDIRAKLGSVDLNQVRSAAYDVVNKIPELQRSRWYNSEALEEVVGKCAEVFDRSFDYWRELYKETCASRDRAYRASTSPSASATERRNAERRVTRANREVNLLLNDSNSFSDSDFYPYRYLATQGFLPGYNFTRLPVRTLVRRRMNDETDAIDRPRFLGLTEFGPNNILYHEGRKHRVSEVIMPPDGIESRMTSAKICTSCDYIHDVTASSVESCENCGVTLSSKNMEFPQKLLDMPTSRAYSTERISSEEEERMRSGYEITTHYRFQTPDTKETAQVISSNGNELAILAYAPSTSVWRINHGWRSKDTEGFALNPNSGRWLSQNQLDEAVLTEEQEDGQPPISGIKPYVRIIQNIVLIRASKLNDQDESLITLSHALKRGLQLEYQVEENEIEVEIVGEGAYRQILLCEAAEGGIGIGERLIDESRSLAQIARKALEVCHYNIEDGQVRDGRNTEQCANACYECLLSYSNQREHALIDRKLVRDFLVELTHAEVKGSPIGETRAELFDRLCKIAVLESSLEEMFIKRLYDSGCKLPDMAQYRPTEEVFAQADFYYEKGRVCVFVDGPHHDNAEQTKNDMGVREDLEDLGYKVLVIRHDSDLDEQIGEHPEVFGRIE